MEPKQWLGIAIQLMPIAIMWFLNKKGYITLPSSWTGGKNTGGQWWGVVKAFGILFVIIGIFLIIFPGLLELPFYLRRSGFLSGEKAISSGMKTILVGLLLTVAGWFIERWQGGKG